MKTNKKLIPDQPGTKRLMKKYGKRLICVRYKYDEKTQKRIKTVELLEEENRWIRNHKRIPDNKIMKLKIRYGEVDLGLAVKSLGGRWNKEKKYWELPYGKVLSLGLENRIIDEETINS
jgi:hypothetical protein